MGWTHAAFLLWLAHSFLLPDHILWTQSFSWKQQLQVCLNVLVWLVVVRRRTLNTLKWDPSTKIFTYTGSYEKFLNGPAFYLKWSSHKYICGLRIVENISIWYGSQLSGCWFQEVVPPPPPGLKLCPSWSLICSGRLFNALRLKHFMIQQLAQDVCKFAFSKKLKTVSQINKACSASKVLWIYVDEDSQSPRLSHDNWISGLMKLLGWVVSN